MVTKSGVILSLVIIGGNGGGGTYSPWVSTASTSRRHSSTNIEFSGMVSSAWECTREWVCFCATYLVVGSILSAPACGLGVLLLRLGLACNFLASTDKGKVAGS